MKREDFEGEPCSCAECSQAGVTDKPLIRDRYTGVWLHGYNLKRWYEAKAKFQQQMAELKIKAFGRGAS